MQQTQLFLLHFAGGNRYSFQFMLPFLQDFAVIPLELAGRGSRIGEPLLTDFDEAARDLYRQLTDKLRYPGCLIYGHSMGAYLGLRVANMLEAAGKYPAGLIVSGNAGPCIEKDRSTYHLPRADFIEELNKLGGIPPEMIENEELFSFFEPILRADMEIAEKKNMTGEPAINAPLFALMGSDEAKADKISNWSFFTQSHFNSEILKGDHFFIYKHPARIAAIIRDCCNKSVSCSTNF